MKVNGADLVVRDDGGDGIPVLLIHGSFAKDFHPRDTAHATADLVVAAAGLGGGGAPAARS